MCCINRNLPEILKDLRGGRTRTIELQSTHNIVSIAGVKPGPDSHIFMTSVDLEDLDPGDQGICVIVVATSVSMKRMVEFSQGRYYEERERISARIQVKYCASSSVKKVFARGFSDRQPLRCLNHPVTMPGNGTFFFITDFSSGANISPGKAHMKEQSGRAPGYLFRLSG